MNALAMVNMRSANADNVTKRRRRMMIRRRRKKRA